MNFANDVNQLATGVWEHPKFGRIIRFGVVGVLNTLIYYALYLTLLKAFDVPYFWSHLVALVISVVGSFFLNCYFTYRVRPTWSRFVLFPLTTLTNNIMTTVGVVVFVEVLKVPEPIAPLIAGICAIPATYVVTTFILSDKSSALTTSMTTDERAGSSSLDQPTDPEKV